MRRSVRVNALVLATAIALTACGDDPEPRTSGGATGATPPTAGAGGTGATATGPTSTGPVHTAPTGPTGPTAQEPPELEDGRHFAFLGAVDPGERTLVLDLAYFLTGEEATEAAREHGDEYPPPNDYYIVNDNPRLRTLSLSTDLEIVLLDWRRCCDETFRGDLDLFAAAVNQGETLTLGDEVYQGRLSPYWLTVSGGEVVRIEEQYLP